jgi:hypothetical protein
LICWIHTANPCQYKTENLAADNGEVTRKHSRKVAAYGNRVAAEVGGERSKGLSLSENIVQAGVNDCANLDTSAEEYQSPRSRAPVVVQNARVEVPKIPVCLHNTGLAISTDCVAKQGHMRTSPNCLYPAAVMIIPIRVTSGLLTNNPIGTGIVWLGLWAYRAKSDMFTSGGTALDTIVLMAVMKDHPKAGPLLVFLPLKPLKSAPWLDTCNGNISACVNEEA